MTKGMKLTIPEFHDVTSILDKEDISYDVWNVEDILFGDTDYAEVSVKIEDFDYFKSLVDANRESNL